MKRALILILIILMSITSNAMVESLSFSDDLEALDSASASIVFIESFSDEMGENKLGNGSGFVAFDGTTIITNYHVVKGSRKISILTKEDKAFSVVRFLVLDEKKDIAILELDTDSGLTPLSLSNDWSLLKKGQNVVALGYPLGYESLSKGTISSLPADEGIRRILFTAPISPGSSGGALFDDKGNVIGITSSTLIDSQNMNFAISSEYVIEARNTAEPNKAVSINDVNWNPAGEAQADNFFANMKLTYLDGYPFDSSVFLGKPTFLNIWATWCPPCLQEMPHLDELNKEYKDRINIIGLHAEGLNINEVGALISNDEKNLLALQIKDEMMIEYPLLNPDTTLFVVMNDPQYGLQVEVLPTTWLIDGEGYIRDILTGARDKAGWAQTIDGFLAKLEEEGNKTDDNAVPAPEGTTGG